MFDSLKARWNFWRITGYKPTEAQVAFLLAPKADEEHTVLYSLGRAAGKTTALLTKATVEARRGAEVIIVFPDQQRCEYHFNQYRKLYKVPHLTQFQRHPNEAYFPSGGSVTFLSASSPLLSVTDPRTYRTDV